MRLNATTMGQQHVSVQNESAAHYDPELYFLTHDGTAGDVDFYKAIASGRQKVLELGAGGGRIAEHLVSRVERYVGVDIDPAFVRFAQTRVSGADFICADMCDVDLNERFDAVIIPFNTLYALSSRDARLAALEVAERHLRCEGVLAFDVYNPDIFHYSANAEGADQSFSPLRRIDVDGRAVEVEEKSEWNISERCINARYRYRWQDGLREEEYDLAHHYVLSDDWRTLLGAAGLPTSHMYGSFALEPFDARESEQLIVCAQRCALGEANALRRDGV